MRKKEKNKEAQMMGRLSAEARKKKFGEEELKTFLRGISIKGVEAKRLKRLENNKIKNGQEQTV